MPFQAVSVSTCFVHNLETNSFDYLSASDGPHNDPKLTQDSSKRISENVLLFVLNFASDTVLGSVLDSFSDSLNPQIKSKYIKHQDAAANLHKSGLRGSKTVPKGPQDRPYRFKVAL